MDKINLKGFPIQLVDDVTEVGVTAEDVTLVNKELNEISLFDLEADVKVLVSVPSLDTGVCQAETRRFNEELGKRKNTLALIVSKDLPFASKRFCETEGLDNVMPLSDYRYGDFGKEFGTEMVEGALKGLLARVVFVLDKENKVVLTEVSNDILEEPNYEVILNKVDEMLG
ncbi:MAG: thiol peroxidase [Salibacteraceae bacterium]|jgi:thiol peroxidase